MCLTQSLRRLGSRAPSRLMYAASSYSRDDDAKQRCASFRFQVVHECSFRQVLISSCYALKRRRRPCRRALVRMQPFRQRSVSALDGVWLRVWAQAKRVRVGERTKHAQALGVVSCAPRGISAAGRGRGGRLCRALRANTLHCLHAVREWKAEAVRRGPRTAANPDCSLRLRSRCSASCAAACAARARSCSASSRAFRCCTRSASSSIRRRSASACSRPVSAEQQDAQRAAHLLQLATQRILQLRQRRLLPLRREPGIVVFCRISFPRPLHPSDLRQHRRARCGRSSCSAIARPHVATHNNWHAAARRKGTATAAAWAWPTSSAAAAAEGHPPREELGRMRCAVNETLGPAAPPTPRPRQQRARRFLSFLHSRLALPRPCSAEAGARTRAPWLKARCQPFPRTLCSKCAGPLATRSKCSAPPRPTAWIR